MVKKNPPVRYSTQPLSNPATRQNVPSVSSIAASVESGSNEDLTMNKLPPAERSRLSQYEINVHVYDNNPQNRFVLINMSKYKEGDRLPSGGPLIAAITPEGVVVDTGSGKALLERNN